MKHIPFFLATTLCVLSLHAQAQAQAQAQDAPLQGTLFFQYGANASKGNHEHAPGKNFASQITRMSPSNGPRMVGLDCYGVTFDPRTNRMCFARGRDITHGENTRNINVFYTCNLDGTNVQMLQRERVDYSGVGELVSDFTPSFAPNGDLLFETQDRMARMNGDGSNVRFLTGANEQCGMPQASGNSVVFEKSGVCVMNADGKGRLRLASFPTYYGSGGEDGTYADAQLSPDGKRVAFVRGQNGKSQVFVADATRPETPQNPARRVSDLDARLQASAYSDPVWSPDGRFLAVAGGGEDRHDVFLIEVSSGKMRQLTRTDDLDEYPCDWDLIP